MIFTVYTCPDGTYLLVPESAVPSHEAESLYGPLEYCARVDSKEYPIPAIWDRVLADIDQHSFAAIQAVVGRQLLGIDCPGEFATSWDAVPMPASY